MNELEKEIEKEFKECAAIDLSKGINWSIQIEQNDYRMRTMEQSHGNEYVEFFDWLVQRGYPIQNSIDACWELFKP